MPGEIFDENTAIKGIPEGINDRIPGGILDGIPENIPAGIPREIIEEIHNSRKMYFLKKSLTEFWRNP